MAVGLRARQPDRVSEYDTYYPAVSTSMVVLIIGDVTAVNAAVIRPNQSLLAGVTVGIVVVDRLGYVIGFLVSHREDRQHGSHRFSL
jgi:BASS family bile acid:Na+ symporter